jgi:soluble lytic murein transglycosylase
LIYKKLFLLLICTSVFAQNITLQWLEQQPQSYAKDFYIWRYLNQNITPEQANEALAGVRRLNTKILYRYINRSKDPILQEYKSCMKENTFKLVNKKDYCIEAGLSMYDATKLSKKELQRVIYKVKKEYPDFADKLAILDSALPFKSLIESDTDTFFGVFNQVGSQYRHKYFNQLFPINTLNRLKEKKWNFTTMIQLITSDPKMTKAQKSLLHFKDVDLNFKTTFAMAINAIKHKKHTLALKYLDLAYKKAYFQMEKDNVTFWQYQLTKQKKYLELLATSWDVNLYTLFAHNELKKPQANIIFEVLQDKGTKNIFDISNPFKWHEVLDESKSIDDLQMKKYENIFSTKETLGHLTFLKERYNKYKKSYFITPYEKYIGDLNLDRQALIYAIARQESRFIPTSISTSYAMGIMQIMPFLSRALAKELKEPYDIDKQLEPKTNLKYANHHLNFLDHRLNNPLFIAYAYNGGIGFTKRTLKTGLFKKGKFEPWLSMELIPYSESKKYGKKVLANYYVYQNYLNPKNKIFFNELIKHIKNY